MRLQLPKSWFQNLTPRYRPREPNTCYIFKMLYVSDHSNLICKSQKVAQPCLPRMNEWTVDERHGWSVWWSIWLSKGEKHRLRPQLGWTLKKRVAQWEGPVTKAADCMWFDLYDMCWTGKPRETGRLGRPEGGTVKAGSDCQQGGFLGGGWLRCPKIDYIVGRLLLFRR